MSKEIRILYCREIKSVEMCKGKKTKVNVVELLKSRLQGGPVIGSNITHSVTLPALYRVREGGVKTPKKEAYICKITARNLCN
jgi:hypothetical protein